MDLTNLSSNWKKLQQTFDKSSDTTKRKRAGADEHANKRQRTLAKPSGLPRSNKKRKAQHMLSCSNGTRARSASAPSKPKSPSDSLLKTSASHTDLKDVNRAEHGKINEGNSTLAVGGKYIALDCEMVGVGPAPHDKHQLARVSLVNYHGEQVYDSFVLPKLLVTDYRTAVSGVTPELLKQGRSFEEVQEDVATLLHGRILVGHALKNDLSVLMLSHPKQDTRDTSHHKPFRDTYSAGRIPSLRTLANEVLGLHNFQEESHDSVEDARVAMLLFKHDKDAFELRARHRFGPASTKSVSAALQENDGHVPGKLVKVKTKKKKKSKKK